MRNLRKKSRVVALHLNRLRAIEVNRPYLLHH
jgi:hypothetical protein